MSEAKSRHLLNRVVPLMCFFSHRLQGYSKSQSAEMVSQGCQLHARTIQRLAQEFLATNYTRYIEGEKTVKVKEKFTFAPFEMGVNRNHKSIMYDEVLRARATVWMRMNNVRRKGKPNIRAHDFLHYLKTDLLKSSGDLHMCTHTCSLTDTHALNTYLQAAVSNCGLRKHS